MKKIPIKVTPAFLITAGIIGYINAHTLSGVLAWVAIIFISVLVHEMGHALTAALFGQNPRIELVAFGGLTTPEGPKLKPWKEFLVVLMGPVFGFLLFVIASIILQFPFQGQFLRSSLQMFRIVNFFWTIVNLMPILPLDGGQLLRIVLEKIGGAKMWRVTLFISIALASIMSVLFFLIGQLIIGGLFLLFILQNFEMQRRFQNYSEADQDEGNQALLKEAEELYRCGQVEEAVGKLEYIIQKATKGIIHNVASEYLARIFYDEGQYKLSYDLLTPIEKNISREGKCLLFLSAYETGHYKQVVDLSGVCFQERQTVDIAIRAAASHAKLHNLESAMAWLKTVSGFHPRNIIEIVEDPAFDSIRKEQIFQKFVNSVKTS